MVCNLYIIYNVFDIFEHVHVCMKVVRCTVHYFNGGHAPVNFISLKLKDFVMKKDSNLCKSSFL